LAVVIQIPAFSQTASSTLSRFKTCKTTCTRLAELGLSENVIASISGHSDLREVAKYTKTANRAKMAREGMAALVEQSKKRTTSG
jgi:hypothetical protein